MQRELEDRPQPGKKSDRPAPSPPPDKPRGGKTKPFSTEAKSDKPSDSCPRSSAPGGNPVSGSKPIHFGTGEEVLHQTDFVLDGPHPIAWTRCYRSGSEHADWSVLGARWSSPFTASLLLTDGGIIYIDDSGRAIRLPPLAAAGPSLANRKEGFALARIQADEFILTWRDGSTDLFTLDASGADSWLPHGHDGVNAMLVPGSVQRAQRYTLRRAAGRDGRGITIERHDAAAPGALLLRVRHDDGRTLEAMRIDQPAGTQQSGARIGRVDEVRDDGTRICRVRYDYAAETVPPPAGAVAPPESGSAAPDDFAQLPPRFNLIRQTNIAGAARRYAYRHHLLLSCSTYGGFTATLTWISLAALRERWRGSPLGDDELRERYPITPANSYQARATGSVGEDGSDALHIDYIDNDTSRVTDALGGVLEYTFDGNWLAVDVRRVAPGARATSLGRRRWDRDGMLLDEIDGAGRATRYTHDAAGNVTSSTDALGRRATIAYDAHQQASVLTDAAGATTRLSYDAAGRLAAHTDALGHTTRHRYDALGRLIETQDAKGGVTRLEYNPSGQLIAYTDCSGQRSRYRYDQDDRVSAAIDFHHHETRYDYDVQGRLLYEPDTFVPLARIESAGGHHAMTGHDETDAGSNAARPNIAVYLANVQQWDLPSKRGQVREQDAKAATDDAAAWRRRKDEADEEAKTDRIAHFNCDHLGTPRELFNSQGEIVWSGRFKAWGARNTASAYGRHYGAAVPEFEQPLRFQGQFEDRETGLHYNRYRYYDSDTARYVQSDPIGLAGGINTYIYGDANPVSKIDPLGLATFMCTRNLNNVPFRFGPLFHQYICVPDGKGGQTCGGLGPSGRMFDSPGVMGTSRNLSCRSQVR